jgi:hypothetical protein
VVESSRSLGLNRVRLGAWRPTRGNSSIAPRTNHLLFLDECGTHDLTHVDPQFPVFVLAGVLVGERYCTRSVVPRIQSLKRRHRLGATNVLHSRDIRRCHGPFAYLQDNEERKLALYSDINGLFDGLRFRLVASVIDQRRLLRRFICPVNPYEISISQLLSLTCGAPGTPGPSRPRISQIIAENRGKAPDRLLDAEYSRLRRHGSWNYGERGCLPAKRRFHNRCGTGVPPVLGANARAGRPCHSGCETAS